MKDLYDILRERARRVSARYPRSVFYRHYAMEAHYAATFLNRNRLLARLKAELAGLLTENLGHGLSHAVTVCVDAGALASIEGRRAGYSRISIDRLILLSQVAALLHDLCRTEKNHAERGAEAARTYLSVYPFTPGEQDDICRAILGHEAFRVQPPVSTLAGRILSDCLYDADKFRWGSDNFTHMLWDMVCFADVPVSRFVDDYPRGLEVLRRIRGSFRTRTGKQYGPGMIDTGIAIGEELYRIMKSEFHLF